MARYVKCVLSIGRGIFTEGNIYEVMDFRSRNASQEALLLSDCGEYHWMYINGGSQFVNYPAPPMCDAEFDLDELETARAIIAKQKVS